MTTNPIRAAVLFGPTAAGKTALLESLSRHRRIEVISADSRQIYRGFAVSTAYPPPELLRRVPHHLVGTLEFTEVGTVADFIRCAQALIPEISARGALPVISGGTAYYLLHLLCGKPETPPPNPAVRHMLQEKLAADGLGRLYAELCEKDPAYAARIAATDTHRVLRGLEICLSSGRPVSAFKKHAASPHDRAQENTQDAKITYEIFALHRDKEDLHARVEVRADAMRAAGLEAEARALYRAGLRMEHTAARTIGVQEFLQHEAVLRHWEAAAHSDAAANTALPEPLWQAVRAEIIKNTKRYAKRQYTFFAQLERAVGSVRRFNLTHEAEHSAALTALQAL